MPVLLDIPAQSLEHALKAFTDATHVVLFYEGSVIMGRLTFPLRGEFPADLALRQMLQGMGLSSTPFERGTMTMLSRAKAGVTDFSQYLAQVQRSLDLAFCHAPVAANDPDEMLARVWLAPSGEV
ncbi:hypothetical protein [Tardiphaga sp.]|jgi:hypothetical protein|uniref:hypothetical protein n=1 Tax=Tardiphaga sp. TaxID=1926292 RepID=UPI0037DA0760